MAIGSLIGCGGSQYYDYRRQRPKSSTLEDQSPGPQPTSEQLRLPVTLIAGPLFILAYFWLAWTSFPSIPVIVPMLSGLWFGAGSLFLFAGFFNYLTDSYYYAASALAASTITRSCFGAGFPLFTHQVYPPLSPLENRLITDVCETWCAMGMFHIRLYLDSNGVDSLVTSELE